LFQWFDELTMSGFFLIRYALFKALRRFKVQRFKSSGNPWVGSSPVPIVEAIQLSNGFVYLILNPSSRLTALLRRSLRGIGSAVDFDCW
jgi:hypothetical protein